MTAADSIDRRMQENADMLWFLPKEITDRENPAARSGWFEYRFLSLMERTRRFASDYCDRYRWTFGRAISYDFEPSSDEFATLWKMRKSADIWGVSYPLYLENSFYLFRNPKHAEKLAVPNDIFAKREDTPTWRKRFFAVWDQHKYAEYSRLTRMPQYWLENDRGLPAQLACRRELIDLAKHGKRFQYLAETYSIGNKVVPIDDILGGMTDSAERVALKNSIVDSFPRSGLPMNSAPAVLPGDLLQTCFGLPRKSSVSTSPCSTCSHQRGCALAADKLVSGSYRPRVAA